MLVNSKIAEMKNLIRILLYVLLALLVVAIAYMIYQRGKTPVDDAAPTAEMADSLFMDAHHQASGALTAEDSMILDLTGQLPAQVGAPIESSPAPAETPAAPAAGGTIDYSKPVTPAEQSAAVNTNPKAQKVSEKSSSTKAETATTNKVTAKTKAAPAPKTSTEKSTSKTQAKTASTNGYYVVSGSFIVPAHADKQVQKLKKLGYSGANKKVFGSSEYYSAVVGSYDSRKEAEQIVSKLKAKGEQAFLKAK